MIEAIFKALFKLINSVLGVLLTPVNLILDSLFPNLDTYISNFNNFVDNYIIGTGAYFFNFIPPITKSLLVIIFTFFITYKAVVWSYRGIILIFNIIRKIKFW